jgi:hypothetical protein
VCGYCCPQSGTLTWHTKRHHTLEGQQRQKTKEQALANFLTAQTIEFRREHGVDFSCLGRTSARVDFLLPLKHTNTNTAFLVCLENDEGQHKDRMVSCELRRMTDVAGAFMLDGNSLPVVWIRFNCDSFQVDGQKVKVLKKDKFKVLGKFLQDLQGTKEPPPQFSVHYFSTTSGFQMPSTRVRSSKCLPIQTITTNSRNASPFTHPRTSYFLESCDSSSGESLVASLSDFGTIEHTNSFLRACHTERNSGCLDSGAAAWAFFSACF